MGAKAAHRTASPNGGLTLIVRPNPFNPTATVEATVIRGSETRVEVFEMLGSRVAMLFEGTPTTERLTLPLDGSELASGTYLVRVYSGGQVMTRSVKLLK